MLKTANARERLRLLGQTDLAAMAEIMFGEELWSIQHKIGRAMSVVRAKVAVPSCNASGKTYFAGRLVQAFYEAFTPGTPCLVCGGPCGGAKVITMSSKETHLRDNLWGELRSSYAKALERGMAPVGQLWPGDLRLESVTGKHYIIGQTATAAEGIQGAHAAHKLIVGDEATSVSEEVSQGITSLMASGDTRLLLIFNPTDTSTYAAQMSRSERVVVIPISAYDTPSFTGEHVPEGSNLINQNFLDDLIAQGMGPGTYEWTTRVLGEFWDLTDDTLVAGKWFDDAVERGVACTETYGVRQCGVDIAPYGNSENAIYIREGNRLLHYEVHPAMRVDLLFQGPVTKALQRWGCQYLVYDADGVGAGAIAHAEAAGRHLAPGGQVIGFRGALKIADAYTNARSAWYWALRKRFEAGTIEIDPTISDPKLREQLTTIRYSILNGAIRVETKAEMRKRGVQSPDRADGLMYAFAMSEVLPMPGPVVEEQPVVESFGVPDHSERAMWERDMARHTRQEENAVLGLPD